MEPYSHGLKKTRNDQQVVNMANVDPETYGRLLMQRVSEAFFVAKAKVSIGDWKPEQNMCHYNVTYFCQHNPGCTPVRGWLYFDLPGLEVAKFLSHSVVRTVDGTLCDITPWEATQDYAFLPANLSEDEYAELIEQQGYGQLHPRKQAA